MQHSRDQAQHYMAHDPPPGPGTADEVVPQGQPPVITLCTCVEARLAQTQKTQESEDDQPPRGHCSEVTVQNTSQGQGRHWSTSSMDRRGDQSQRAPGNRRATSHRDMWHSQQRHCTQQRPAAAGTSDSPIAQQALVMASPARVSLSQPHTQTRCRPSPPPTCTQEPDKHRTEATADRAHSSESQRP